MKSKIDGVSSSQNTPDDVILRTVASVSPESVYFHPLLSSGYLLASQDQAIHGQPGIQSDDIVLPQASCF